MKTRNRLTSFARTAAATLVAALALTTFGCSGGGGGGGNGGAGANTAPQAESPQIASGVPGSTINFRLGATDPDGDALTYEILTMPSHGMLTGTAPDLVFTPDPDFIGTDRFTYRASDGLTSIDAEVEIRQAVGIVCNSAQGTVTFFAEHSLEPIGGDLSLGSSTPGAVVLSEDQRKAYVLDRNASRIVEIDLATRSIERTLSISQASFSYDMIRVGTTLFVTFRSNPVVCPVELDGPTLVEGPAIPVSPSAVSSGAIAATPDGRYLYVGGFVDNWLTKIDAQTRQRDTYWNLGTRPLHMLVHGDELLISTPSQEVVMVWNTTTDALAPSARRPLNGTSHARFAIDGDHLLAACGFPIDQSARIGALSVVDLASNLENYERFAFEDGGTVAIPSEPFPYAGAIHNQIEPNLNGSVAATNPSPGSLLPTFWIAEHDWDASEVFELSQKVLADRTVIQWSVTQDAASPASPAFWESIAVFEAVVFNDGRVRYDYHTMPTLYTGSEPIFAGVTDTTGVVADLSAQFGDPLTFAGRSFMWDPNQPSTFSEVPFVWESTGATPYPVDAVASDVAVAGNYVFVCLERERYSTTAPENRVEVFDRKTFEWVASMTVGFGPRAIAIQN